MMDPTIKAEDAPSSLNLDVLMERLRLEVAARRSRSAGEQVSPDVGEPSGVRLNVDDLLALPEAEFVATAHATILGRKATPEEMSVHLDRLLLGDTSRTKLVYELLSSSEGRARGVRAPGLWRAHLGVRRGVFTGLAGGTAYVFTMLHQLPRQIRRFVKRLDVLEKRAMDMTLKIEALEHEIRALKSQAPGVSSRAAPGVGLEPDGPA